MSHTQKQDDKAFRWLISGCLTLIVLAAAGFAGLYYLTSNYADEIADYFETEFSFAIDSSPDNSGNAYGASFIQGFSFGNEPLEGVDVLSFPESKAIVENLTALVSEERFAEADEALDHLLEQNAYDPNGYLMYGEALGKIYESQGTFALERCMQWLEATRSAHALALAGEAYINAAWEARGSGWANTVSEDGWRIFRHNLEQARMLLSEAISKNPNIGYAYARLVTVSMGQNEPSKEAYEYVQASERHAPLYLKPHYNYAYSLLPRWGGSHTQQMEFINTHLKNAPDNAYKYYTLLRVLDWDDVNDNEGYRAQRSVRKQWTRILDSWEKTWPEGTRALLLKVEYHYELEEFQEVITNCRKAIERDPEDIYFHRKLGQCYLRIGDFAAAIEPFKRTCELSPDDVWAHYWLGQAYYYAQKYKACIEPITRAIALFDGDYPVEVQRGYDYLAYAYSKTGESEIALGHANKAVELNRNDSWAYYHRGIIRTQLGNRKEAKLDFHKCISLDPERKEDIEHFYPGWEKF